MAPSGFSLNNAASTCLHCSSVIPPPALVNGTGLFFIGRTLTAAQPVYCCTTPSYKVRLLVPSTFDLPGGCGVVAPLRRNLLSRNASCLHLDKIGRGSGGS